MTIPSYTIERIVNYCRSKKYQLFTKEREINIVYVEGMGTDGTFNIDEPNQFNDVRMVLDSNLRLIECWSATTEPGRWYTNNPINPKGAARIAFGQYKAWRVGTHGNSEPHEALIQVAPVKVFRDRNKDMKRTEDITEEDLFGINQHWGYDYPVENIGLASAGCLVGRLRSGHRVFMAIVKRDIRYVLNSNNIFSTIIIPGNDL